MLFVAILPAQPGPEGSRRQHEKVAEMYPPSHWCAALTSIVSGMSYCTTSYQPAGVVSKFDLFPDMYLVVTFYCSGQGGHQRLLLSASCIT